MIFSYVFLMSLVKMEGLIWINMSHLVHIEAPRGPHVIAHSHLAIGVVEVTNMQFQKLEVGGA